MNQFIGRETELKILEESVGKGKAVLLYGRRRIGKTTLLRRFCRERRHIFITALSGNLNACLDDLHSQVTEFRGADSGRYSGFGDFISDLKRICTDGETVIVIDEYQYLVKAERSVNSHMQLFIDSFLSDTDSTLILNGSKTSVMRALGEDAAEPLFGRFRRIIELKPLSFVECKAFHPDMPEHDQLMLYMTFGGVPRYHLETVQKTYRDAIRADFIDSSWIADEVMFLLKSDIESSDDCSLILSAIAEGSTSLKHISERTGFGTRCVGLLETLLRNGIVGKINPMLGAPKRAVYYIRDDVFAFYYAIVRRNWTLMDASDSGEAYDRLHDRITTYLGLRFEQYCMELVKQSFAVDAIGRWWMDDPEKDIHEEIDIVARIGIGTVRYDLFAECKFTSRPAGFRQYNDLVRRASRFSEKSNPLLMIFSEGGFEEDFEEFAEAEGILLAGPDEIHGNSPMPRPDGAGWRRRWIVAASS